MAFVYFYLTVPPTPIFINVIFWLSLHSPAGEMMLEIIFLFLQTSSSGSYWVWQISWDFLKGRCIGRRCIWQWTRSAVSSKFKYFPMVWMVEISKRSCEEYWMMFEFNLMHLIEDLSILEIRWRLRGMNRPLHKAPCSTKKILLKIEGRTIKANEEWKWSVENDLCRTDFNPYR